MQASPNILCNGPAVKLARVEPKERTSHECSMFTGPKVTEPHVYLDFTSEGRPLGRVVRRDPAKGLGKILVVGLYGKLTPEVAQNFHGLELFFGATEENDDALAGQCVS
eukprot:scaffold118179_cov17-Tisochrysis_lutea.AAC.2